VGAVSAAPEATRTVVVVLFCALLTATLPTVAAAKDLCLTITSGIGNPPLIVLKAFTTPGKGKCKPVAGWVAATTDIVEGAACSWSNGTGFTLGLHRHSLGCDDTEYTFTLSLPALTGGVTERDSSTAGTPAVGCGLGTAKAEKCSAPIVPIP
jgi:hypothetical protein